MKNAMKTLKAHLIESIKGHLSLFIGVTIELTVGYTKLFSSVEKKQKRKIFGKTHHSIEAHMPVMYRFMSLLPVAAEADKRMFNDVR